MNRSVCAAASLVFFTITSVAALADTAADKCGGKKLKAAGRYASSLHNCDARALKRNEAPDPACSAKAEDKLASGFAKADSAGGCVATVDDMTVALEIAANVDDVNSALAPADNDDARACAATKGKGAGKYYRGLLNCYGGRAGASEGPTTACLDMAYAKLVGAFSKAESAGGCTVTGDLATIEGMVSPAAENVVRALSPVCGDAITGPTQQCEIGDDSACPGLCSAGCVCVFPPDCGDGVAALPEECDDGNIDPGDGCSASCQLENTTALCAGVATTAGTGIDTVLVSSAFNAPIHATAPRLDPSRLFVVERQGRIRIVNLADDTILPVNFLDITDLVGTAGEGGLLSMAFDPAYESNRRFYLNYTNTSGHTTIARYEADSGNPNIADESTAKVLLVINQPFDNHNGGQIAFGPDGYLYVGMGDGGGGGDPQENAQDDGEMLGKMLRMDVNVNTMPFYAVPPTNPHYVTGTTALELIWAKGTRNPWRFSFDRDDGALIIADVGQGNLEEIDYQPASSTGGENYGWDIFEGDTCFEPDPAPMCPSPPTGFTMPIFEYNHSGGCTSITGGFVYRGCAMPDLASVGRYFYSDVCHNWVRTIDIVGGAATNPQDRTAEADVNLSSTASFGEDARGEVYIVDLGGSVYRITPN